MVRATPDSLRLAGPACLAALLAALALGADRKDISCLDQDCSIDELVRELRSDPDREPGEKREDWYVRISVRALKVADIILAHPDAVEEHTGEAIDRKLTALALLSERDPARYRDRWTRFANRIIEVRPGSPQARDAARRLLEQKIRDDPADPGLLSEIDGFTAKYTDSAAPAMRLYVLLARMLYDRDRGRAIGVLDRAIRSLPSEMEMLLRQHKNRLTMIGTKLTMEWPTLNGERFSIEDLRGKVVFVYPWATWCSPCVEKFPVLAELHSKYHARGFELVTVSHDDETSAVIGFFREHALPGIHVMQSDSL